MPSAVPLVVTKTGYDLIRDPALNKGSAFTAQERSVFGLNGLLPARQNTLEQQQQRAYARIELIADPLDKYVALAALHDRNETLFYRVLLEHLDELMPVVYTPTVGLATQKFSHVFQPGRGVWITPDMKGHIEAVLRQAAIGRNVRLIVATDNESILGIGDQGAGGMAISIGKLALYVAGAGIAPTETLPVSLDVGTNNTSLLEDDLYLGHQQPRLQGEDYADIIDEFVTAVRTVFPESLLQWEDFRKDNALEILDRYRPSLPSFNDDIQGTGAVALAALIASTRITGQHIGDHRVAIYGAGAAGLGIARQIKAAMVHDGVSPADIARKIAVLDSRGLIVDDQPLRDEYKRELAWGRAVADEYGLADSDRSLTTVVEKFAPTALIGSSGDRGAFDETIVKQMARNTPRPVILPFSNPTDYAEGTPADILGWSSGQALVATGSPFADVELDGRTFKIGQGNNVFIFPGLGLGTLAANASTVTDDMVSAASRALADTITEEELARGMLFPGVERLREVSGKVAAAVAHSAIDEGIAQAPSNLEQDIDERMWVPEYRPYVRG